MKATHSRAWNMPFLILFFYKDGHMQDPVIKGQDKPCEPFGPPGNGRSNPPWIGSILMPRPLV